ncbi:MAG: aldo/keto reductase [Planctomycetaceae bacterium]
MKSVRSLPIRVDSTCCSRKRREIIPWCQQHDISFMGYWPLMKGLLAGKMTRDHQFDERDSRRNYPIFQGEQWERNQDLVDVLKVIAKEVHATVAQVVLKWTLSRAGMTSVLCGARRPDQIRDNGLTVRCQLELDHMDRIEAAIHERMKYYH